MDAQVERTEEFKIHITHELEETNARLMKKIAQRGGGKGTSANILAGEGADHLRRILNMKADKQDIEKLQEVKCNKMESQTMLDI